MIYLIVIGAVILTMIFSVFFTSNYYKKLVKERDKVIEVCNCLFEFIDEDIVERYGEDIKDNIKENTIKRLLNTYNTDSEECIKAVSKESEITNESN